MYMQNEIFINIYIYIYVYAALEIGCVASQNMLFTFGVIANHSGKVNSNTANQF